MILDSSLFVGPNISFDENSDLTSLGNLLKERIKSKKDLFETTNLIFPSDNLAQWFRTFWLKTESEVLMNVRFVTLEDCLHELLDTDKPYTLAKRHEIRTLTIKCLLLLEKGSLETKISEYIYDGDAINSVRLYDLADKLSSLFCNYEKEAFEFSGWQLTLYEMVMNELEEHGISTFSHLFKKTKALRGAGETYIFFGFNEIEDLYVPPIKELAIENNVVFYALTKPDKPSMDVCILAAPSKTREIEALHSEICAMVNESGANFSDFLVLSPDTSAYERDITRVFNQDNESFPNIPFNINSKKRKETDITEGLKQLFEISTKKFFSRLDFAQIINNKAIQQSRSISPDDIETWLQAVVEMNVYRNGKRIDDWTYAKKRLVLSKVASLNSLDHNIVELVDGEYMPYESIGFENESIIRFVSTVDDLHEWIETFSDNPFVEIKNLDILKDQLLRWFSVKNPDGGENNKLLLKLLSELNFWRAFSMDNGTIPVNTLFYSLFDLSQNMNVKTSSLFVEGVTFADYDEKSILPAKYLFFIGASSKDFPAIERRSEIDLRPERDAAEQQFASFESQCSNAGETVFISYVNRNLKTDEEYFPSTLLLKLLEEPNCTKKERAPIGIDETRTWAQLFTKKEYKEKDYYIGLFGNNEYVPNEPNDVTPDVVKKVTVSQMKNFLTEPLKYKFEQLFGRADEMDDYLNDQYEPITFDKLTEYILVKSALLYMLKHPEAVLIDEEGEVDLPLAREVFKRFIIEHKIPNINDDVEDMAIRAVIETADLTKKDILSITDGVYEITKINDFHFKHGEEDVVLMYNGEVCLSTVGNTRKYIELAEAKGGYKPNYLVTIYVCALMDIASLESEDEYHVEIYRGEGCTKDFAITPQQAREQIIKIYQNMNSFTMNAYMPIEKVNIKRKENPTPEDIKEEFDKLIDDAMGSNGAWRYFKDQNMFIPPKDLGYTKYTYEEVSSAMRNMLRDLVIYLRPTAEEE